MIDMSFDFDNSLFIGFETPKDRFSQLETNIMSRYQVGLCVIFLHAISLPFIIDRLGIEVLTFYSYTMTLEEPTFSLLLLPLILVQSILYRALMTM